MKLNFPVLTETDIEVRVGMAKENGCSLLLYKDARCDRRILNQTLTPYGWQRRHRELKGVIYCSVGIQDPETKEWIWKEDAGAESYTEKEKGEASDSFKRACFNWGIGEELYTAPFVWINAKDYEKGSGNNPKDRFAVEKIAANKDRQIYGLSIINTKTNKRVYQFYNKALDDTPGINTGE